MVGGLEISTVDLTIIVTSRVEKTCVLRSTTSVSSHLRHRSLALGVGKRSRFFWRPNCRQHVEWNVARV
uniref:Uncharacterized protein n=1 Tax=Mesocestoides corti TaxID=53468 RepID=A0A5K3FSR1_MESCO